MTALLHLFIFASNADSLKPRHNLFLLVLGFSVASFFLTAGGFCYEKYMNDRSTRITATVMDLRVSRLDASITIASLRAIDASGNPHDFTMDYDGAGLRNGSVVIGAQVHLLYNVSRFPRPLIRDTFDDRWSITTWTGLLTLLSIFVLSLVVLMRVVAGRPLLATPKD